MTTKTMAPTKPDCGLDVFINIVYTKSVHETLLTKIQKNVFYMSGRVEMTKVITRVQDAGKIRVLRIVTPPFSDGVRFTKKNIDSFLNRIKGEYDRNSRKIIVDLSRVKSFDDHAVNELLIRNGKFPRLILCFCCPEESVRSFLKETNFSKVFAVYETEEEALRSFSE